MSELFANVEKQKVVSRELADTKFKEMDVWRDVGGLQEADRTSMKLLAMTDPVNYAKLKSQALVEVKTATEASYKAAFDQHIAAGVPVEEAKKAALSAAKATKELQNKAMKLRFHDDDSIISAKRTVQNANAFKGLV
jgi:hypothetical protein